jgi:Flp pilus assembly pilin Flp
MAAVDRRPAGPSSEVSVERLLDILASEEGQTTAEYSLVLLAVALVVAGFAAFVKTGHMSDMFKEIVSGLIERARG